MVFGIQNIGSTCYLNCAMQIIHACPPIKRRLSADDDDVFTCAVRDMNIPKILQTFAKDFPLGLPHDTYEVYLAIIDRIEKTIGKDLFYGTSETTIINRDGSKSLVKDTYGALIFSDVHSQTLDNAYTDLIKGEFVSDEIYKQTTYTTFPQVLVCVFTHARQIEIPETFKGRKLKCAVCHQGGHYISIVYENGNTFLIDDDKIYQGTFSKGPVYMAVYSDG